MQREWRLAHGRSLILGPEAVIMGVLNVTPDSFSDGGVHLAPDKAIEGARAMIAEGAHIIDVGGESTRPGAIRVDARTEQARVLPVIEALAGQADVLISVDTYREETARLAVAAGAHIVNDVWGVQREPAIADLAAQTGAGLVIMHTGRERERDPDVIVDQFAFLNRSLEIARLAGVAREQIVLDPGFGFAKETEENLALMRRFAELQAFGYPFLAGTSRKRFLGAVTGRDADQRDVVTAATSAILRLAGADVFRVHDIGMNRDALAIADAMLETRGAKA
ncbi:dihydropteroate synthase [Phyllobacterium myrsinacearum]|uniref:dihydropteroate synthase n=1 Tax=Phyllobacterium myrsinacearum TaxID=28101 RepID=UPI001028E4A7|nr:dihydropteroate synthase [Phyllobacterium myrsinacearum]RZS83661.1 dihydropteroate synthase [Phyllobacterium myrsinacearum]